MKKKSEREMEQTLSKQPTAIASPHTTLKMHNIFISIQTMHLAHTCVHTLCEPSKNHSLFASEYRIDLIYYSIYKQFIIIIRERLSFNSQAQPVCMCVRVYVCLSVCVSLRAFYCNLDTHTYVCCVRVRRLLYMCIRASVRVCVRERERVGMIV